MVEEESCKGEFCLDEFEEEYNKFQEKYQLPSFEEMNETFHIEKIADVETRYFLREIRKFMSEKFSSYSRFLESMINPSNGPMFIFPIVRILNAEDKKVLSDSYRILAKIQVDLVENDLHYSESSEVNFIKESYTAWKIIEGDLLKIVQKIKLNWDKKFEENGKGYFG